MFLKLLILGAVFKLIAAAGFGILILLKSNGRVPEKDENRNSQLRNRGISCARQTETGCHLSERFQECSICGEKAL